jgi:hypothetical protein
MVHNHLCLNYTALLHAANSQSRQLAVIAWPKEKAALKARLFLFKLWPSIVSASRPW